MSENSKNNILIFNTKGETFFMTKEVKVDEDIIDHHFLDAYDQVGFLDIEGTQYRMYFGVDDEPKVWNYNPFLSSILEEPSYSDIIIFVDMAEFDETLNKKSNQEFEDFFVSFLADLIHDVYPEETKEKEPSKDITSKFGFTDLIIHSTIEKFKVEFEEIDSYFEEFCMNKFSKPNIYQGVKDKTNNNQEVNLLYKDGVLYVLSKNGKIDCYFHPMYSSFEKIITKNYIN